MKSLSNFINETIINEHFVTIFDKQKQERYQYAEQVWKIIEAAYEYIGGLSGCKNYDDFVQQYVEDINNKNIMWKMVRRGTTITAIKIYSMTKLGRKAIASGALNTPQGIKDLNKIIKEDIKMKDREFYAECSGKALGKYLNEGVVVLPNSMAFEVLKGKQIEPMPDGYFYRRKIKGELHVKLLVGYPNVGCVGENPDDELIKKLKELGKKYESEN